MTLTGITIEKKNWFDFCFSAKNERLVDDIVFLIKSLGFYTNKTKIVKICTNGKNGPVACDCFRFGFGGDGQEDIPCLLERKKAKKREINKSNMVTGIKINKVGKGKYFNIVTDDNGKFLLDDFTVVKTGKL